ncbi:MAG: flagellar basal body P-ring formation chaperone FlgA [Pikeienuella sp.]|uniref:flagellar basal body P-ring formation chaperone FlgA n=1 Tax=Pikeienuella sp. TaxID=2831957 RepID=UPI00391C2D52
MSRLAIRVPALLLPALLLAAPLGAESLVASRAIPARSVIGPEDLRVAAAAIPGALSDPAAVEGMETKVTIYEGRPIRAGDLVPAAIVERNQIVRLRFERGPLEIAADGRALDRGAVGERIRVMNLASRVIVTGDVAETGDVIVSR